jgi:hypothetical protein
MQGRDRRLPPLTMITKSTPLLAPSILEAKRQMDGQQQPMNNKSIFIVLDLASRVTRSPVVMTEDADTLADWTHISIKQTRIA